MTLSHFQPYRWIMPMFLHANFLHLIMNTFAQFILGALIESIIGFHRIAAIYLLSGYVSYITSLSLGGTLFGCLINDSMSVGASGAIFGLCGALVKELRSV